MNANRAMVVYFYTNGKPQRKPDRVNLTMEDVMAGRGIRVTKNDTFLYNDKLIYLTNGALLKKLKNVVDHSKFVLVPTHEQFISAPYDEIFPFHYGDEETKKKVSKQLIADTTQPDKLFCPHHNRYCRHKKRPTSSCCANCCGDDDEDFTYTVSPASSKGRDIVRKHSPVQVVDQQLDKHETNDNKLVAVDVKSAASSTSEYASMMRDLGRQMERIDFECKHGTHAMKIYRFGRRRGHKKKQRRGCCSRQTNSDSELENV